MDCPKCGGEMEKGGIPLINSSIYKPFLPWIREETFEKSNNFPKWLWNTADEKIYGENTKQAIINWYLIVLKTVG